MDDQRCSSSTGAKSRSKARQAKRAKALDRRRGRKPGATPLTRDQRRWEVALFGMLVRTRLRGRSILAAEFAASVLNKSVTVTAIEGGLSFNYTGGRGERVATTRVTGGIRIKHDPKLRDEARRNRRDKILREAPRLIEAATGADRVWLEISMQALDGLFNAIALCDDEAMSLALKILGTIGWPVPLTGLFLK